MLAFNEKNGNEVTAAVIQGNVSSLEKWEVNTTQKSTDLYEKLTRECVAETGAKIIVWPETVIPTTLNYKNGTIVSQISDMAKELQVTVFVGAFDMYSDKFLIESQEYNAIFIFNPDGKMGQTVYHKRHLVPFGEYTPMESLITTFLPVLSSLNILSDPLTPGEDSEIFSTEYGNIGSLICFDSIYEMLAIDSVRDGAQLLTLSTNDSWFGDSTAVWQHNSHAALRAIETGRYIVRAANTGVSSIINPEGKIMTLIKPLEEGYSAATVYMRTDRTFYSYIGNIFVLIAFLYVLAITAINLYSKVKKFIEEQKKKEYERQNQNKDY